ncbi:ubiquitin carboxyl-terminal hydrolase 2-like [Saccoglossus kowalevskii]|uniref:ubiquitinyl hydrolase 1 n=1 Tax=Saccoglossus kowalevskii TaxID=10224 RepID=A0ABM0MX88_SACKO|nr:PREDICTED: ubiquitin carboxyl-terminal hydrolase 8-like [Saccoglossus kowalevskii]
MNDSASPAVARILASISQESLWLVITEYLIPLTFAFRFIAEIVLFITIDGIAKSFLSRTRTSLQRRQIWLYEALILLLISGLITIYIHQPFVLWALIICTFGCSMLHKDQRQYNQFHAEKNVYSSKPVNYYQDSLQKNLSSEIVRRPLLPRPGIARQRSPILIGESWTSPQKSPPPDEAPPTKVTGVHKQVNRYTPSFTNWFSYFKPANTPPGLQNRGQNLCFMNSVLQCLAHTPLLAAHFANQVRPLSANQLESALVAAVGNLLEVLNVLPGTTTSAAISTTAFRSATNRMMPSLIANPDVGSQSQQDASEFLTWLLSALQTILNNKYTLQNVVSDTTNTGNMLKFVYGDLSDERVRELKELCQKTIENANGLNNDSYADAITMLSDLEWLVYCRQNNSIIDEMFTGQFVDVRFCCKCSHISVSTEPFTVLPVAVPEQVAYRDQVKLKDCIATFSSTEELSGRDSLVCSHCCCSREKSTPRRSERLQQMGKTSLDSKELAEDEKMESYASESPISGQRRSLLRQLPECLIVQLMRFRYDSLRCRTYKKHTPITIPLNELDLSNLILDTVTNREPVINLRSAYYLYSLCLHLGGQSASCGHYVAYSKALDDNWYKFDDDYVTMVSNMEDECNNDVIKENAYLLFFKRK